MAAVTAGGWSRSGAVNLVLGTGQFSDGSDAAPVLDAFVAGGGLVLDTAARYGYGLAEQAVGAWLRSGAPGAAEVVLIGKGAHPADDWTPRLRSEAIEEDLAGSLARLGRDSFDLYLFHRDDPLLPPSGLAELMHEVIGSGRATSVGISNCSRERWRAISDAGGPITAVSNHYGLGIPGGPPSLPGLVSTFSAADHADLEARGWPLVAWSAGSGGYFAAESVPSTGLAADCDLDPESRRRRGALRAVAFEHGVDPADLVIRWLATAAPHVVPVVSSGRPDRVAEMVAAAASEALDPIVAAVVDRIADPSVTADRSLLLPRRLPRW